MRVVEASAGSGKTYALAKRYVQLILNPDVKLEQIPIRNVLALTFTNKAAFEMKARILEFLKRIALKQFSSSEQEDILRPIGLTSPQASLKAFNIMEGVIRHYNFFQVQTIDKFINAILSGCAFKIGLTANFKIKTNPGEYLQYSLDRLVDRAQDDRRIQQAFERFLHHYLYLENRSGWFPKNDMLEIITALFDQNNIYGHQFREGRFAPEDVIKKKSLILEGIRSLRDILPETAHAGFTKAVDVFLIRHTKGFDIDSISDYFTREEIPVKKGALVSPIVEKKWRNIRSQLTELCQAEACSLFNPYIEMFFLAMDGFYELAAKDDCLFLNELNKRAGLLFDDDRLTVEELYYRLATRFHHYLIDEFQDTSSLQWHNLEKMVEEGLSTGGTLFYVGDRKQAIYGFRGGDVGLFDNIKRTFQAFNVRTDILDKNWRSQKAIVEFNNAVFSLDNLQRFIREKESYEAEKNKKAPVLFCEEDMAAVHAVFQNAQQTFKEERQGGYVSMEYVDMEKKEERDEAVREKLMALVKGLRGRFAYRDIAILTRGNKEIKEITNWLLNENIPVESERTSDITENALIRELISFLKFLDSPIDNLAFTAFILGNIFSRATGVSTEEMHKFVFSFRERLAHEKNLYVYTEFRGRYPQIWSAFLEDFFRNVGLYPLYELMITIYSRFRVLASCGESQGFLMHFLELIKACEEEHTDVASFLEYFEGLQGESLYVHVADADAVKVLTIHKSKGLEFPVVILPFLGIDIQIGASSGEYQPSYILQQEGDQIELLRMKTKYLRFSEDLYEIYSREYKKAFFSELNSLYVALTRPRNELYGFIPKLVGKSFNFVQMLIPESSRVLGQRQSYEETESKNDIVRKIPPPSYPNWIDYLKDEFLDAGQVKRRERILKGEIMHYILSMIGNLKDVQEQSAIRQAMESARLYFDQIGEWEEYAAWLEGFLHHKDIRRFFDCAKAVVLTEQEIVNRFGDTKRCDRLIVRENEVQVLDFKSARIEEGGYAAQVEEYKDILKDIYPKRTIKGFLVYLDCCEVEEV